MNNKHLGIFLKIGTILKDLNGSEYIIEGKELKNNHNLGHSDADMFWIVRKTKENGKFKTHKIQKMSDLFLQQQINEQKAFII